MGIREAAAHYSSFKLTELDSELSLELKTRFFAKESDSGAAGSQPGEELIASQIRLFEGHYFLRN